MPIRTFLTSLGNIAPTYLVLGSPAIDIPLIIRKLLTDLPVNLLENQVIHFEYGHLSFEIIGLTCTHIPNLDIKVLDSLHYSHDQLTILLHHSPNLAPYADSSGVDIQLSGHTHGGQVRLPLFGAIVTGSIFGRKFQHGRYQLKDLTQYISAGIGMEGMGAPRVRFLCRPEIVTWVISALT
jgi:predicted MPP superfamily phosphohydrolase